MSSVSKEGNESHGRGTITMSSFDHAAPTGKSTLVGIFIRDSSKVSHQDLEGNVKDGWIYVTNDNGIIVKCQFIVIPDMCPNKIGNQIKQSLYDSYIVIENEESLVEKACHLSFTFQNLFHTVIVTTLDKITQSIDIAVEYWIPEVTICHQNRLMKSLYCTYQDEYIITSHTLIDL